MSEALAPVGDGAGMVAGWVSPLARKLVLGRLKEMTRGRLTVEEPDRTLQFGKLTAADDLAAVLHVHHPRLYSSLLTGGTIGAAEAYMRGDWSSGQVTDLCRLLLRNRRLLDEIDGSWSRLAQPLHRLYHRLRDNTLKGSRRNIAAHYDLSNDFYRLFLDPTMMYSCALFSEPGMSLQDASLAKNDRICRKLELRPGDHLLEIGTGWGGFAIHAAGRYGCRVTTTTISREQYELARERVDEAGLGDLVTVIQQDYRRLEGRYDKLVSIEMIEAVGHRHFPQYFARCSELLSPDGMMLLQAITIADQYYESARDSVDFIKRYIFPGSCIPSVTAIGECLARHTDLRLFHLEDITPHYALTLREWRKRFKENLDSARALGFSEGFIRMWDLYFCYCEAGFEERYIGDVQMLLTKPECRREPILATL